MSYFTQKPESMLSGDKVIGIYCIGDDILNGISHKDDSQRWVSDSKIITNAIVSVLYFGGHMDNAREFMKLSGFVPKMLGKSRLNRRLHHVEK